METIEIRPQDEASHFFIVADVLAEKLGKKNVKYADEYEVSFKVNGVELPFSETIKEIYSRIHQDLDQRAGELLIEKAQKEISAIDELTSELTLRLKKRAKELFNVELDED